MPTPSHRAPQSSQSVPSSHFVYQEPSPPSSQTPLPETGEPKYTHVFEQPSSETEKEPATTTTPEGSTASEWGWPGSMSTESECPAHSSTAIGKQHTVSVKVARTHSPLLLTSAENGFPIPHSPK